MKHELTDPALARRNRRQLALIIRDAILAWRRRMNSDELGLMMLTCAPFWIVCTDQGANDRDSGAIQIWPGGTFCDGHVLHDGTVAEFLWRQDKVASMSSGRGPWEEALLDLLSVPSIDMKRPTRTLH